ncbi:MAG: DNA polymerase III subunit delta [Cellvibrionales bacterium TMED148]|nr:DNA polymerase III subunit delta [Porticoccaceae bacterium]RPG92085.1 MAG: DNA polymerase III subunit delta [Cellvibrionales bacterium TMED148]
MKIKPHQLRSTLANGLKAIYLVSGDELLLVQEASDILRSFANEQGFQERAIFDIDGKFDWNQVIANVNTLSLFGTKKILELRLIRGKLSDQGSKTLVEVCKLLGDDNLLLLVSPKLDRSEQSSIWLKTLTAHGVHIEVPNIKDEEMPAWLAQRLKERNIQLSRDKIQIISDRVEGNLLAAAQEIEKLELLALDNNADELAVSTIVTDSTRYNIFDLINKILLGDTCSTGRILRGLQAEGTQPLQLLWAILTELRKLIKASRLIAGGESTNSALIQAGVWKSNLSSMRLVLKRCSPAYLRMLLYQAAAIDRGVKGLRESNVWDELTTLIISLSGSQILRPMNIKLTVEN